MANELADNGIEVRELVRIWLETPFEGGRHARRVNQPGRSKSSTEVPSGSRA